MKVVFVLDGFYNGSIRSLDFMTKEMDFVSMEMSHLESIRTSGNKTIVTYDRMLLDGRDASGMGQLLSKMKLQAVCVKEEAAEYTLPYIKDVTVGYSIRITDIHIYDRTEKAEIYIIPKSDILSAVIDITEEVEV